MDAEIRRNVLFIANHSLARDTRRDHGASPWGDLFRVRYPCQNSGPPPPTDPTDFEPPVTKAFSLLIILIMAVQLVYPLGLPGLKRRRDFWKLALVALGVIALTILIRP